jgi:hypothetical protein
MLPLLSENWQQEAFELAPSLLIHQTVMEEAIRFISPLLHTRNAYGTQVDGERMRFS